MNNTSHFAFTFAPPFLCRVVRRSVQPTLLIALHQKKVLTTDQVTRGFAETVEFMQDMKIDIPKAPEYLYKMLGALAVRTA